MFNPESNIERNIDLLTGFVGKTNITCDLNLLFNDCRLTLLNLRHGFKVQIKDLAKSLNRNNESECVNFFLWISNQVPRKKWVDLSVEELRLIIDEYALYMEKTQNFLYVFRDSVLSYIHLAQKTLLYMINIISINQ